MSYVILNQEDKEKTGEMEALKFYPFRTSIEGNNLHSRLVYKSKQSQTKDGQNVDLVKYHLSEEQKQSFKDNSGDYIIEKDAEGQSVKDESGNPKYLSDLDEIADAFVAWGKEQGLSFFK